LDGEGEVVNKTLINKKIEPQRPQNIRTKTKKTAGKDDRPSPAEPFLSIA
jgi:hypothetical protein